MQQRHLVDRSERTRLADAGLRELRLPIHHHRLLPGRTELEARRRQRHLPALYVFVLDDRGVTVHVSEGPLPRLLSVGRHAACDVLLHQRHASLRHAVIAADDDGVSLVDLASSCGISGTTSAHQGTWACMRTGDAVIAAQVVPAYRYCSAPEPDVWCTVTNASPERTAPREAKRLRGEAPSISLDELQTALLLGRDGRNDLTILDENVSRVHAVVLPLRLGGVRRAVVIDAGSTNGTEVLTTNAAGVTTVALGPALRGHVVEAGDIIELSTSCRVRVRGMLGGQGKQLDLWGKA
jgi:hypothetical protein